jgi:hypothetical protein
VSLSTGPGHGSVVGPLTVVSCNPRIHTVVLGGLEKKPSQLGSDKAETHTRVGLDARAQVLPSLLLCFLLLSLNTTDSVTSREKKFRSYNFGGWEIQGHGPST